MVRSCAAAVTRPPYLPRNRSRVRVNLPAEIRGEVRAREASAPGNASTATGRPSGPRTRDAAPPAADGAAGLVLPPKAVVDRSARRADPAVGAAAEDGAEADLSETGPGVAEPTTAVSLTGVRSWHVQPPASTDTSTITVEI
ncbi:hypothetical protein GCM10010517_69170 [Streptosporangium fragile]|uniref:Uncharacterized protein n=1 Tax=Streptosporangium fragile TaxID=46186 RepID=A0ABN3W8H5_9ACTN